MMLSKKINSAKVFAAAIAAFLAASLLSGCKSDQNSNHGLDPNNPVNITIWHYYNGVQQENFDSLVLEFNETVGYDRGIVVEARSKGSIDELAVGALASLRGDVGADDAPEMFASYAETAYTADRLGKVVDLSEYFTSDELDEYVSGYLDEGNLNDKNELKIFPIAKSTEVMMINLTDWQTFADSEGVSTDELSTWEGLAQVSEKYYKYTDALTPDVPNDGRAFFGRDSVANYMIIGAKQLGLEYFSTADGSYTMNENKDAVKRLWECYYVPYVNGYYAAQSRFRSDDAKIGTIIAMVCSTTGAAYFPSSVTLNDEISYPIEKLVLNVPNFEGTEPYAVQQGAGMVVVKSDEKKEYACSVFLKWFTEQDRNIGFSANSGYLPVKKAANDFSAVSESYKANGGAEDDPMLDSMRIAVDEVNSYQLYAAKPFERSAETRDFLGEYIQNTAQSAHDAAAERIAGGEDRDTVLTEYTSDAAFEAWYADFISGLKAAAEL